MKKIASLVPCVALAPASAHARRSDPPRFDGVIAPDESCMIPPVAGGSDSRGEEELGSFLENREPLFNARWK